MIIRIVRKYDVLYKLLLGACMNVVCHSTRLNRLETVLHKIDGVVIHNGTGVTAADKSHQCTGKLHTVVIKALLDGFLLLNGRSPCQLCSCHQSSVLVQSLFMYCFTCCHCSIYNAVNRGRRSGPEG